VTTLSAPFTSTTNITSCEYTTNGSTWLAATVSGTAPSFTCTKSSITSLVDGTSYTFNMHATNSGGTTAATSLARIGDTVSPTSPVLTAIPGNAQVSLSWTTATDARSGLHATTPYKVVFATGATAPANCSSGTQIYLDTGNSYSHTGLTNGTQYSYRACAIDAVSNMSAGTTASATPSPQTYTVTVQPATIDNGITAYTPNQQRGSEDYFALGVKNTIDIASILLSFDFSANVPVGATVNTATLSLYFSSPINARVIVCDRLRRTDWVEDQSTWNIYKNNNSWSTAGALNTSTDMDTTNEASVTTTSSAGWFSWNVKNQVQYARDSVSGVAHFLIRDTSASISSHQYLYSSEYATTSLRPKLYIEYTY
jgi:hypothetical protein